MCAEWRIDLFTGLLRHFIPRNDKGDTNAKFPSVGGKFSMF